jgi:hypothetical protein
VTSGTQESFKTRLQRYLKIDLALIVNENRSTMLNLLEKRENFARLSVHKMFLEAPDSVVRAIADYVQRGRKYRQESSALLRTFIQEHLTRSNYTHLIESQKLLHVGRTYHLKPLYDRLNLEYFGAQLDLSITWYGKQRIRPRLRSIVTFGQYLAGLRLIKIHRMLDDPFFPHYFVAFVVYHEMLHSVIPTSVDARGRLCFHTPSFKEREKAFTHYREAIEWEKKNKTRLFQV